MDQRDRSSFITLIAYEPPPPDPANQAYHAECHRWHIEYKAACRPVKKHAIIYHTCDILDIIVPSPPLNESQSHLYGYERSGAARSNKIFFYPRQLPTALRHVSLWPNIWTIPEADFAKITPHPHERRTIRGIGENDSDHFQRIVAWKTETKNDAVFRIAEIERQIQNDLQKQVDETGQSNQTTLFQKQLRATLAYYKKLVRDIIPTVLIDMRNTCPKRP